MEKHDNKTGLNYEYSTRKCLSQSRNILKLGLYSSTVEPLFYDHPLLWYFGRKWQLVAKWGEFYNKKLQWYHTFWSQTTGGRKP